MKPSLFWLFDTPCGSEFLVSIFHERFCPHPNSAWKFPMPFSDSGLPLELSQVHIFLLDFLLQLARLPFYRIVSQQSCEVHHSEQTGCIPCYFSCPLLGLGVPPGHRNSKLFLCKACLVRGHRRILEENHFDCHV